VTCAHILSTRDGCNEGAVVHTVVMRMMHTVVMRMMHTVVMRMMRTVVMRMGGSGHDVDTAVTKGWAVAAMVSIPPKLVQDGSRCLSLAATLLHAAGVVIACCGRACCRTRVESARQQVYSLHPDRKARVECVAPSPLSPLPSSLGRRHERFVNVVWVVYVSGRPDTDMDMAYGYQ
jgi:hypothetical protein